MESEAGLTAENKDAVGNQRKQLNKEYKQILKLSGGQERFHIFWPLHKLKQKSKSSSSANPDDFTSRLPMTQGESHSNYILSSSLTTWTEHRHYSARILQTILHSYLSPRHRFKKTKQKTLRKADREGKRTPMIWKGEWKNRKGKVQAELGTGSQVVGQPKPSMCKMWCKTWLTWNKTKTSSSKNDCGMKLISIHSVPSSFWIFNKS